jgi:hypothetical protein
VLTDLYPNIEAYEDACSACERLGYHADPVDATDCDVEGFRTIFTSFHHFPRDLGVKILADAVRKEQGIAVFEAQERTLASILQVSKP